MIYGVGETVLDILFRDDQPRTAIPGGSTFNAMVSLGRCGIPCQMLCQTGDDRVGDLTLNYLKDNGVGTGLVTRVKGMKSHLSLAFLDEHSDAHYTFYKDHNGWAISSLMEAAERVRFTPGDALLLGSFFAVNPLTRPVVKLWLDAARAAGALIYYDLNFRPAHRDALPEVLPLIEETARLATVVRASRDDLQVTGMAPAQNWLVTDGGNVVRVYTETGELTLTPPAIKPVSTVGAGDNFNAGFLYRYMKKGLPAHPDAWTADDWMDLARTGIDFGQQVCQSWENSIPKRG